MSDIETPGLIASALSALGLTGWGGRKLWTISSDVARNHTRLKSMESDMTKHEETIEQLKTDRTETTAMLGNLQSDVGEINDSISAIKDHITGTKLG